jgi:hypothetical protein
MSVKSCRTPHASKTIKNNKKAKICVLNLKNQKFG